MPQSDTTYFWLTLICVIQFGIIGMLVSIGIQIMKENLDFRKRLGREFVKEPSRVRMFVLASVSYVRMIYSVVFNVLENKLARPVQVFLRFVNSSVNVLVRMFKGLGSRVVALARIRSSNG